MITEAACEEEYARRREEASVPLSSPALDLCFDSPVSPVFCPCMLAAASTGALGGFSLAARWERACRKTEEVLRVTQEKRSSRCDAEVRDEGYTRCTKQTAVHQSAVTDTPAGRALNLAVCNSMIAFDAHPRMECSTVKYEFDETLVLSITSEVTPRRADPPVPVAVPVPVLLPLALRDALNDPPTSGCGLRWTPRLKLLLRAVGALLHEHDYDAEALRAWKAGILM